MFRESAGSAGSRFRGCALRLIAETFSGPSQHIAHPCGDAGVVDALTGKPAQWPDPAPDEVSINNMLRGQIDAAVAALKLFAPERGVRLAAAQIGRAHV